MKSGKKISGVEIYALAFGLFLGLCIWKFGNPVILDQKISSPNSFTEFWNYAWPTHWANWILLPLAVVGAILAFAKNSRWPQAKCLWLLPLVWFGWQIYSSTQTVDSKLTATTLWQFAGCVVCYFLGAFLFENRRALNFLLIGILTVFVCCLVKAFDQRLFEFPESRQFLVEGERANWTNTPPEMTSEQFRQQILQMKQEGVIVTTNGTDIANPAILAKFERNRVNGTLVYPNALAGAILLLFPVSLALAFCSTNKMKPPIRFAVIALTIFLGSAALFWTGSKLGWLIAIGIGGLCLFRLNWPMKLKIVAITVVAIFGLGIFAVRFHNYFSAGATSISARFDYWRAAIQTTESNPLLGTGPGTFQRPYEKIKSPDAEMARLAHNDYLEQFSDSGIPGGIFYATWIFCALATIGRKIWEYADPITFAIFIGLLGWFVQGVGEFSLYIPALAWTAFILLGCLFASSSNQFDKRPENR